jgi:cystathionine beta-lyase
MDFDFDRVIDRTGSNSEKWDIDALPNPCASGAPRPIPMWVADMDFQAPPPVLAALREAVDDGVFGYARASRGYSESVMHWMQEQYGWRVQPEWLVQTAGVVAALSQIIQAFTQPGDGILIQSPVYARFQKVPMANGRRVVNAPLQEEGLTYRCDVAAFEAVILRERPRLFILCHPHNPVGKVWHAEELRALGEVCLRHGVLVVSDEIHADLIMNPDRRHVPFATLGDNFARNSITCTSPSKTFNLAGLQIANVIISDTARREALLRVMDANGNHGVNSLAMVACEAAYRRGEPWLQGLLDYLKGNHLHFAQTVHRQMPGLRVFRADALYLAWLDCRALGLSDSALADFMLNDVGLWLDAGEKFGAGGSGFMRVNLACSRSLLDQALMRMQAGLKAFAPSSI